MPQIRIYLSEDNQALHDLNDEKVSIGRLADNTIQIEDASVSSHHAEIAVEKGEYHLHDKGSTNGTFVNGQPVTDAILRDGSQVRFGSVEAVFSADAPTTASQPLPHSERATANLGSASARPANFVNASPFPKPKEKTDGLTYAAVVLAVLGAIGFLGAVALSFMLQVPA
ncbi:MAG: FHA domain-containing protein [Terrimicrobiaceae bacterium]|nr:FHA domain-containing protein [Terrimicrobiaceae bacterium]